MEKMREPERRTGRNVKTLNMDISKGINVIK